MSDKKGTFWFFFSHLPSVTSRVRITELYRWLKKNQNVPFFEVER
jgi:hypothetical protein